MKKLTKYIAEALQTELDPESMYDVTAVGSKEDQAGLFPIFADMVKATGFKLYAGAEWYSSPELLNMTNELRGKSSQFYLDIIYDTDSGQKPLQVIENTEKRIAVKCEIYGDIADLDNSYRLGDDEPFAHAGNHNKALTYEITQKDPNFKQLSQHPYAVPAYVIFKELLEKFKAHVKKTGAK